MQIQPKRVAANALKSGLLRSRIDHQGKRSETEEFLQLIRGSLPGEKHLAEKKRGRYAGFPRLLSTYRKDWGRWGPQKIAKGPASGRLAGVLVTHKKILVQGATSRGGSASF